MKISSLYLIGVGGTGSLLAEPLTRLLTFHSDSKDCSITFVDGDKYNIDTNMERQIYDPEGIGEFKARYTAGRLSFLSENIHAWVTYVNESKFLDRLSKPIQGDNNGGLIVVIAAVDNHRSRLEIIEALLQYDSKYDWLFITPGNNLSQGQVTTFGRINRQQLGNNPADIYPDIANPTDIIPSMTDAISCHEQAVASPQLISANFMAAASILCTIQAVLDNKPILDEVHFDVYKTKMMPGTALSFS